MSSASQGSDISIVYVTVPPAGADDVAKKLASSVIENKLAACVNIVPGITSVYWWEGKVEESAEQLLIMKTQTTLVERLTEHVQSNHPYDECEVISAAVTGGSLSYLAWVKESTQEALTQIKDH